MCRLTYLIFRLDLIREIFGPQFRITEINYYRKTTGKASFSPFKLLGIFLRSFHKQLN